MRLGTHKKQLDLYGMPNYNTVHSYRQEEVVFHSMCVMLSVLFTKLTLVVSMTAWNAFFIEIAGTNVGSNGSILVGLLYRPPQVKA